jgi:hypothetical protein
MTWAGSAAAAQQIASKLAPTPFGQKQKQIASKPAATPFGQKRTQMAVRSASGRRPWEQSEVTTVAMGCAAALKTGPMFWVPLADAAKV